jgi:hypothetical protein
MFGYAFVNFSLNTLGIYQLLPTWLRSVTSIWCTSAALLLALIWLAMLAFGPWGTSRTRLALTDDDPMVVIGFDAKSRSYLKDSVFDHRFIVLCNRGNSDAHDVEIEPVVMGSGSIAFPAVPLITKGGGIAEVDGRIGGDQYGVHDFELLLRREWESRNDNAGLLDAVCLVKYRDAFMGRFLTVANVRHDPLGGTTAATCTFHCISRADE